MALPIIYCPNTDGDSDGDTLAHNFENELPDDLFKNLPTFGEKCFANAKVDLRSQLFSLFHRKAIDLEKCKSRSSSSLSF